VLGIVAKILFFLEKIEAKARPFLFSRKGNTQMNFKKTGKTVLKQ